VSRLRDRSFRGSDLPRYAFRTLGWRFHLAQHGRERNLMTLSPAQAGLLRHISQAAETWARAGKPARSFLLLHLGGLQSTIDHPGWDSTWPTPTEYELAAQAEARRSEADQPDG